MGTQHMVGIQMHTTEKYIFKQRSYSGDRIKFNEEVAVIQTEFDINGSVEACMGLLNDIYEDGVKWHDIACYHTKPFICEESDQLLEFMRSSEPDEHIPEPPV